MLTEINIDGIVGPTHHFGGMGVGNVASIEHQNSISHPRQAALEGLRKASLVASLGVPQFICLPPIRPQLSLLTALGFQGTLQEQLQAAGDAEPRALSTVFSGAFMWMANAATVTPCVDSSDGRLHCTLANLISSWHRASEASDREPQLRTLLSGLGSKAVIHPPIPSIVPLRDEGAANHMRLCDSSGLRGMNVFVFGADDEAFSPSAQKSAFFARHTQAASRAVARQHKLPSERTFFLRQHPLAIDAGVFHNDVIATSCDAILIHHEFAFIDSDTDLERLEQRFFTFAGEKLQRMVVTDDELPLADAVRSYFFNSQILRCDSRSNASERGGPRYEIICPHQCEMIPSAHRLVTRLLDDPQIPIDRAHYVRLDESMAGGGGPACLRLRMMINDAEVALLDKRFRLTSSLSDDLAAVIEKWYPTDLSFGDLMDVDFVDYLCRVDEAVRQTQSLS
jgi:succinylarginine dihydrolase